MNHSSMTVLSSLSSHPVYVSQPEALAEPIRKAAKSLSGQSDSLTRRTR